MVSYTADLEEEDMISEIKVYEITISKSKTIPFLLFFKRTITESVRYLLTYRIDEDRFWYYKYENDQLTDDHLMKSYLDNSISIMVNILRRYQLFNELITDKCTITTWQLHQVHGIMYDRVAECSASKEQSYLERSGKNGLFL